MFVLHCLLFRLSACVPTHILHFRFYICSLFNDLTFRVLWGSYILYVHVNPLITIFGSPLKIKINLFVWTSI
jgi:hypothetical protein